MSVESIIWNEQFLSKLTALFVQKLAPCWMCCILTNEKKTVTEGLKYKEKGMIILSAARGKK